MTFEEVLDQKGFIAYTNAGVSMMPLLREGRDIMMIRKRSQERFHKYDVVLFVREQAEGNGRYILHRILKVLDGGYWIVGDNCTYGEYVREDRVIGILEAVNRGKKDISIRSLSYRLYVRLWCAPYRMRFAILKAIRFVKRVRNALERRLRKAPGE